ncbi:MAG TPA: PAS domain S-box protein [bacterium]|nr:PAS domain S-box protein [bacterium]
MIDKFDIINSLPVMVCCFDKEGKFRFVNRNFCMFYNESEEVLLNKNFYDLIPENEKSKIREYIESLNEQTPQLTNEQMIINYNGEIIWQLWTYKAIFNLKGKLEYYYAICSDITDRKQNDELLIEKTEEIQVQNEELFASNKELIFMTEKLQQSEKRYKTIVDNVNESLLIHDFKGKIIEYNNNLCSLTGYGKKELNNLNADQIFNYGEGFKNFVDKIKISVSMLFYSELSAKKKNSIPISVSAKLVSRDNEGLIQLFIRDISELKKLQLQLIHSEKLSAVGQLAAGIAHEFNNILAIIQGNIQVTLKYDSNKEEMTDTLKIIEEQTKRAAVIVSDMLRFSSIKPSRKEIISITDIMEKALKIQKNNFDIENISLQKKYKSKKLAYVDFDQIQQVFLNLIINARHAIVPKKKGKITITVKDEKNNIVVKIVDNGIGMSDEVKNNLFTPFFTTKGALAKDEFGLKGTGLGLPVSFSIIKNHNGNIKAESEFGKGTAFIIEIPAYNQNEKLTAAVEEKDMIFERAANNEFKILVIDDEPEILSLMKRLLKKIGYERCDCFETLENIEETLKINNYNLVFLDIFMPKIKGDKLFGLIKNIKPDLPVVFISGQNESSVKFIKNLDYAAYIKKPFDIEILGNAINKIILGIKYNG